MDEYQSAISHFVQYMHCSDCPSDWREHGGHCYLLLKNNRKEEDCRDQCFRLGSDLASILNQEENNFLKQYISERPDREEQIGKVGN